MTRSSVACFCLLTLSPPVVLGASLTSDIATHLTASDPKQRYSACLVLGEIPLDRETENRLRHQQKTKKQDLDQLCLTYVLAKRTQEHIYQDEFVKLYPSGKWQSIVWQSHIDAGYPFGVVSPLIVHLVDLARKDDTALTKLVSGLPFADGAYAESLIDELAALYRKNPERISRALRAAAANSYSKLIKEAATQQRGQDHE